MGRDCIAISDLRVAVRGIGPSDPPSADQVLRLDINMWCDTERAARSELVPDTIDYQGVSAQVTFLLQSGRFLLLETAAQVLARYLLTTPSPSETRPDIQAVRLRLERLGGLPGSASAYVEIERAERPPLVTETKPFGTVDIISETRRVGIYRLNIAPGGTIPLHVHRQMQEWEMVLHPGLLINNEPARAGAAYCWPKGLAHQYHNRTDSWRSILCVDRPRFMSEDEIEVPGPPASVPQEAVWAVRGG